MITRKRKNNIKKKKRRKKVDDTKNVEEPGPSSSAPSPVYMDVNRFDKMKKNLLHRQIHLKCKYHDVN